MPFCGNCGQPATPAGPAPAAAPPEPEVLVIPARQVGGPAGPGGRLTVPARRRGQPSQPGQPAGPSTSTVTPIPSSRRGIVSVSPALARRADAQQVAGFLDSYFAAVNHREYLRHHPAITPRITAVADLVR
jgi:hypothetical protein